MILITKVNYSLSDCMTIITPDSLIRMLWQKNAMTGFDTEFLYTTSAYVHVTHVWQTRNYLRQSYVDWSLVGTSCLVVAKRQNESFQSRYLVVVIHLLRAEHVSFRDHVPHGGVESFGA